MRNLTIVWCIFFIAAGLFAQDTKTTSELKISADQAGPYLTISATISNHSSHDFYVGTKLGTAADRGVPFTTCYLQIRRQGDEWYPRRQSYAIWREPANPPNDDELVAQGLLRRVRAGGSETIRFRITTSETFASLLAEANTPQPLRSGVYEIRLLSFSFRIPGRLSVPVLSERLTSNVLTVSVE
jgi:hypothetical protein